MTQRAEIPPPLLSAAVIRQLRDAPTLRTAIFPGGLLTSPYRVLRYQSTVTLETASGSIATIRRHQDVVFLHDGVAAVLDHVWGDGVPLTAYDHSAGTLEETLRDGRRRHLVIGLRRRARRGDRRTFAVERIAMAGFLQRDEYVDTIIDHPADHLSREILFPRARPCQKAFLIAGAVRLPLPVQHAPDGRTIVRFTAHAPIQDLCYRIRWRW